MALNLNYTPNALVNTATLTEDQWLAWRRKGIGGSDVASALGISPYRTARELYYDKIGIEPAVEGRDMSITFEIGHLLEDVVAQIFSKKTGLMVYRDQMMYQHPLYPFMLADVDRFVTLPIGKKAILECKTAHYDVQYLWANGAVPRHYELQVRHYMAVMNIDVAYIACLFSNNENDFVWQKIERDLDEEESNILQLQDFWENYVLRRVEPPLTEKPDMVLDALSRYYGPADKSQPTVMVGPEFIPVLERISDLKAQKQILDQQSRKLDDQIKTAYAMRCKLERIIFQSDGGFCIFSYSTKDETVPQAARQTQYFSDRKIHFTAVGYRLPATDKIEVELDGKWQPSKYGMQLAVEKCEQIVPTDRNGLIAYLSSGFIKGIGPGTAKAIVARFGDRTLDVLDNDPKQLLSVKGIAEAKLKRIISSYQNSRKMRDLATYLAPFDVSEKKIMKIQEKFGDASLSIVRTDPFQLCRIRGFGFLTVDAIARKIKVSLRHPLRYSGAINYVLEEAKVSGNLFLQTDVLLNQCYELLNRDCETEVVPMADIRSALTTEHNSGNIYVENDRV